MKKRKLNYRIINPNTAEVTADYILKIFLEVNSGKVERAVQQKIDSENEKAFSELKIDNS